MDEASRGTMHTDFQLVPLAGSTGVLVVVLMVRWTGDGVAVFNKAGAYNVVIDT